MKMKCFQMVGRRETFRVENENIWKNIPGEKLPKFVGEMETFYWQVSMAGNNWGGGR